MSKLDTGTSGIPQLVQLPVCFDVEVKPELQQAFRILKWEPLRIFGLNKLTAIHRNNPGTAQVGAISKAQKQQKDFKVSKYFFLRYRKSSKVEPNWRTRGDNLRFFIHSVANQKKLKEGHFW